MKRYLCPICDRELTAKSYCSTCRKIVKNPIVYDGALPNEERGNYLLNHQELHPDRACVEANRERVCETPQEKRQDARFSQAGSHSQERTGQTGRTTQQRSASSGTVYQQYRGQQSTAPGSQIWTTNASGSRTYSTRNTSPSPKGKKGCRSGCLTVIIVLWLIGFIGGLLGDLVDSIDMDSWFGEEYEYIAEEPIYAEDISEEYITSVEVDDEDADWSDDTWETVDYEEILAVGEHCNGYWHYPISGEDVYGTMIEFAKTELGLETIELSEEMYNNISHSEYGEYTYYSRYRYWEWVDGFVSITCDSVTDEIHYIGVYSWNADQAIELALKAFGIVEDEESVDVMRKSLYEALEGEEIQEGYLIDMGKSSVWISEDSGEVMIEIAPAWE